MLPALPLDPLKGKSFGLFHYHNFFYPLGNGAKNLMSSRKLASNIWLIDSFFCLPLPQGEQKKAGYSVSL